jgi:hypothetical protein
VQDTTLGNIVGSTGFQNLSSLAPSGEDTTLSNIVGSTQYPTLF